jgi:PPM family protein phosphatase
VPLSTGLSDVGCVRKNNEDSFLVHPGLGLYAVADGMGGAQAGERASRIAIDCLCDYIAAAATPDIDVLVRAFEVASQQVHSTASVDPNLEGMGTTLVAALQNGQELFIANVGDSRAWLFEHGRLSLVTSDQTWVNEVGRPLGLSEDQLKVHPMRHVLTTAIGVSDPIRVQIYDLRPAPGDVILLSSDGLHGPVPADSIEKILSSGISLEARCHSLIEAAKKAGGPDNITAVLLEF